MRGHVAFTGLVFLLSSCGPSAPPAELSSEEEARIAEEVDATVREYLSAIQSLGAHRMLAFWADIEGFAMAGDGALTVGYEP